MRNSVAQSVVLLWTLVLSAACQPSRAVTIAWDAPPVNPFGYRILVDGHVVMDITPPPPDPSCHCIMMQVAVPWGEHEVKVVAYNAAGESQPASVTAVVK